MNTRQSLLSKVVFSLLMGSLLFPAAVSAQQFTTGEPLLFNGDFVDAGEGWKVTSGKVTAVAAPGESSRALSVEALPSPGDKPPLQLHQGVLKELKPNETLRLRFRARANVPVKIAATLGKNLAPFDRIVQGEFDLMPAWQGFEASGKTLHDFSANTTTLSFNLGPGTAKIELADVRLEAIDRPAQMQAQKQQAPVSLIANGDWSAPLPGNWTSVGEVKTEIAPAQVGNYKQALRVSAAVPKGANPSAFQIVQTVKVAVPRESAVYFRAYLRAPNGSAKTRVGMVYEKIGAPNTKVISQTLRLTPTWQEFRFVAVTPEAFEAGQSRVAFFVGYPDASVEIAGARLESYGRAPRSDFSETPQPIDYWNDEPHDDSWKAAAFERIEKLRKADLAVRVVDGNGKAIPDALVKIEMTRHAFRWGVAGKARRLVDLKSADNLRFQAEVKRLYNTFTFENDLKWTEKTPDLERLRSVDKALGWLQANGFEVRGHTLAWGGRKYLPAGVLELPAPELTQTVKERVQNFTRRYRGQVYVWDVVNEAGANVELWDKIGWENFANAYEWARESDPDVLLAYNDYNLTNQAGDRGHRARVLKRLKTMLEAGAPLDIIGEQAHMNAPFQPIPKFLSNLDEVASLGKAIEITEFDLSVKDDKMHGDYVRDILIAAFSHPKVAGFIQWGMWEGDHWLAEKGGAMFRTDWSKRPAQVAYEDQVLNQWWTRAVGKTDKSGNYRTRGFLGNYNVSATAGGKSVSVQTTLSSSGQNLTLILP